MFAACAGDRIGACLHQTVCDGPQGRAVRESQ